MRLAPVLLVCVGAFARSFPAVAVTASKSGGSESGVGVALRAGMFAGVASSGVAASARLGKVEVEGGVLSGSEDLSGRLDPIGGLFGVSAIDKASLKQNGGYAMLKYHPMNGSFYFGFGGAETQSTAKLTAHSSGGTLDESMKVTRSLATLSIGNVWAPGGVMIGCEWMGAGSVLSSKESLESKSAPGSDAYLADLQNDFHSEVRSTSGAATANAFLVYFGFKI